MGIKILTTSLILTPRIPLVPKIPHLSLPDSRSTTSPDSTHPHQKASHTHTKKKANTTLTAVQQDLNTRRRWRRREEEPGRPCDERRGGEDGAVRGDAEFHFAQTAKLRRAGREGVVQQGLGFPAAAGAAAAEVQNRWAVEEGDDVPNRTGIARGKWVVVRIMIGGFFFFF